MSGDALLAIDLGTTRLKVAAFDPDGRLLSLRTRRHGEHREADRVWQSPDEWWTDTAELMQHMLADLDGRRVLGLSLSAALNRRAIRCTASRCGKATVSKCFRTFVSWLAKRPSPTCPRGPGTFFPSFKIPARLGLFPTVMSLHRLH